MLPTRVHAIVLVSKLHKPTLRALAFAKATRPNVLEAVYVAADPEATDRLLEEWDERRPRRPAQGAATRRTARSSGRSSTTPRRSATANPRGVVAVYIPEYVVGRWWEQLLHNQTALRLKGRLLFTPGVMVISVPYQLRSSQIAARARGARAGAGSAPATCAAAGSAPRSQATRHDRPVSRTPAPAQGPRPVPGRRALRGRGRARSPTAATASPGCPSPEAPGRLRPARAARRAGRRSRSPRAPRATGSGAATPSRCSTPSPDRVAAAVPVRRPRPLRRLRLPARRAAGAARAQGGRRPRAAAPAWPARRRRRRRGGRRSRPARRAHDGRPALARPGCSYADAARARPAAAMRAAPLAATWSRVGRLPDRRRGRARITAAREPSPTSRGRTSARPGRDFAVSRRRLLAGAPRRAATSWSRRCSTLLDPQPGEQVARPLRRGRAVRRVPGRAGRRPGPRGGGRGRPGRLRARPGQPRRARPRGRGRAPAASTGCWRTALRRALRPRGARPAPRGRPARGGRAGRRRGAARGGVRRLRPGRAGPRRGDLRRARLPAARRCGPSTCSR